MIFITVGTHEQQFNRLIEYIDKLKQFGEIEEDVIIQTGFSTYSPKCCKHNKLFTYKEMLCNVKKARIVITHGGPASFIMPLQIGKIPVVVPRQLEFNEHVNNHQVHFAKAVAERHGNIIPVYDISEIGRVIKDYDMIVDSMSTEVNYNNNRKFNEEFEKIVRGIL